MLAEYFLSRGLLLVPEAVWMAFGLIAERGVGFFASVAAGKIVVVTFVVVGLA